MRFNEKLNALKLKLTRKIRKLSLQSKITIASVTTQFVTLSLISAAFMIQSYVTLNHRLEVESKELLRNASFATSYALMSENKELATPFLHGLFENDDADEHSNLLALDLYKMDGELFTQRLSSKVQNIAPLKSEEVRSLFSIKADDIHIDQVDNHLLLTGSIFHYQDGQSKEHVGFIRLIISRDEIFRTQWKLALISLAISIVVFFGGVTLAHGLGRELVLPLQEMTRRMELISKGEGNLNQQLEVRSEDELGQMAKSFNRFLDKLNQIVISIRDASKGIDSLTEISTHTITEMSRRAEDQTSFVNHTTIAVKQLSQTANRIADSSGEVLRLANASYNSALDGVISVDESRQKMTEIQKKNMRATQEILKLGKKSREIQRIMHIIHGISVQSKMIAFNAAIEASTSGAIGKRFGVVATQIRELANSVFISTEEIKRITREVQEAINDLVAEFQEEQNSINGGVATIETAMEVLNNIALESEKTVEMMRDISHSTHDQTHSSSQVVFSLQEIMEEAVQFKQNSADAKKTIDEINLLAQQLLQEVNKFKVKSA